MTQALQPSMMHDGAITAMYESAQAGPGHPDCMRQVRLGPATLRFRLCLGVPAQCLAGWPQQLSFYA